MWQLCDDLDIGLVGGDSFWLELKQVPQDSFYA
jgi:hypothetical protein